MIIKVYGSNFVKNFKRKKKSQKRFTSNTNAARIIDFLLYTLMCFVDFMLYA